MSVGTIIDITILLPILYGLVRGIIRGLAKEVISIIGPLVAVIVSRLFAPPTAEFLTNIFSWDYQVCKIVAYILLFLLTAIAFTLIAKMLTKLIKAISLGWLNRLGGGVFGMLKWTILISAIVYCLILINDKVEFLKADTISQSNLFTPISKVAQVAWNEVMGN